MGALPTAKSALGVALTASSMLTTARVVPRASAASRTAGSAMRQTTSTPKRAQAALLIPAAAMFVSVTTAAPFFSASRASFTAPLEKRIFSAKSKSAVVCITRLTTGSSSGAPSQAPISEAIMFMLAVSISFGLISVTPRP